MNKVKAIDFRKRNGITSDADNCLPYTVIIIL